MMRKTTLVNQALLRIRGLSGDRAHPSPSHVFPRSLAPRNRVKCFMITALNCILIRSQKLQRNVSSSTITELPKRYMCGPLLNGRLNWAIVCPDQQQIGNTFHNPRCILPASRVQTLLPHSCTLRGQHPYPGANQTCQSVLPHSHTLVI